MKVGVIGAGTVGAASVYGMIMRNCIQELVLIDLDSKKAKGIITDMQYGACLNTPIKLTAGDYSDLKNADLILITAGVNEKTGGATDRNDPTGRLKLLEANAKIYQNIVPQIAAVAREATIVVATDPPDPLADLTRKIIQHDRVLSTGTYLDSLRFAFHLSETFKVNPQSIEAQVIGEHGTSEVFIWSQANIANHAILDLIQKKSLNTNDFQHQVENAVKFANITIIEGINASQYGIGMVASRIVQIILRDEKILIPIGAFQSKYGITLSLPSVVGREGVTQVFEPPMSIQERQAFEKCIETLSAIAKRYKF